jgi:YndJ-like protein
MTPASTLLVPTPREATAQSLVGFMIWLPAVAILEPGWSPALLAFGPLVLYPILFDMLGESTLRRASILTFLPALASYGFAQGTLAGMLTSPWLVFAAILAIKKMRTLTGAMTLPRVVHLIIAGNLIIGAAWLVLARLGQRPLDYEHAIVHATAVHFHYAGFVLPILALQWTVAAPSRHRIVLLAALLLGVPLVAAGITLSAFGVLWPELIAVIFFTATCSIYAVTQLRLAIQTANWLLALSGASLLVAMSLAVTYGLRHYVAFEWLDIPLMLRTHGPIQVFGFALPGVVAAAMSKQNDVSQ